MTLNRRTFIRNAAMAAATTAACTTAHGQRRVSLPLLQKDHEDNPIHWSKAPCRFCGTGCHVMVGVQDDKVVAIQGDVQADVNKGLLCVKGYHVGSILYGQDRLTTPQIRRNGVLEDATWEEAIDVIAKRINRKPESFAIYGSGQWTIPEGYAAQKFIKGGLSNNHIDPNARLCMASAVTGFLAAYGVDEPAGCYDDLDRCDVLINWGNNPAEMHPVLFSRVLDRKARGESVLIIDMETRFTRSSELADLHIRFKPHADLAIANGIARLLLLEGTYDMEFVERHCNFRKDSDPPALFGAPSTFEEYKELLEPYTPEFVESITGVAADDIRMLAELFGRRDLRITSLWCMGVNQHTSGTAMNTAIHGIHLLSGHFGRPGDAPTSLTGQPSACGTVREVGTLAHALPGGRLVAKEPHRTQCEDMWNLPHGRINPRPGFHTVKMWEEFCAQDGAIDTIWVQVTNPGQTLPNLAHLFDGKKNLEDKFLIVSDVYPTATTALADVVLPSAMWVEKNGIFGNSERRTQQWFRMVSTPGDARDDCWQTIAVAHRLLELGHEGMKDRDGKFIFAAQDDDGNDVPIWQWDRYYDTVNVDRHLYEEYRPFTHMKHKHVAPYDELVRSRGLRWPVVQTDDGHWRETGFRFSEFDDPFVEEGREFQFYHSTTGDDRAQIWFRPWEPPAESPDEEFPLWLTTGRVLEHWHTGSMTARIPQLKRAMPGAYVEMNREDAARMGINNGEIVVLESRRGGLELPVWVGGRGEPPAGTVFVPFFDETQLINELTLHAFDPFSKQPDFKKAAVRVRRRTAKEG